MKPADNGMSDQLRPGQRLIVYANLRKGRREATPPSDFETWLWNISQEEWDRAIKWRMGDE
jgi:hypothetical protein